MSSARTPRALVVGVDGSEADERLADVAADAAKELGASLVLLRVIDRGEGDDQATPATPAHAALTQRVAARTREVEAALEQQRARVAARSGVSVTARVTDGHPFEALVSAATADAWVVVGARRNARVLARTVDLVLRRATVPVLVVPDGTTWAHGAILAGIDAGELDAVVLRTADVVARASGRRLGILHVRASGDDGAMLRVSEHARSVAPDVAAAATVSVMRVEHSVARTIADHATRVGSTLLVVGTHGRRGLERWVLGSTAESLVHESPSPFLVVRQ